MNTPTRLFDCIDLILATGSIPDMLCAKVDGEWKKYSTTDVREIVDGLAMGLRELGIGYNDGTIEGRDKVAVISKNRPEV